MPKENFKKKFETELTGRETEPWEIIYFKLYESQSQMPVIEKAIETAALMLGTEVSRLLSGDDLRGLPGRGQPGQWKSGHADVLNDEIFQIPSRRAEAGISGWPE